MRFPSGEVIRGSWEIPDFCNYIGGYELDGKTVLDVGTASGWIAFSAEAQGAKVTGLDSPSAREFRPVPFAENLSYKDLGAWRQLWDRENLIRVKKSWWNSWHKLGSKNKCVYAPISDLYEWDIQFDVVIAGAIIEHLSDPVYSIGAFCKVAKEAVLLPWIDVIPTSELRLEPVSGFKDSNNSFAWWMLSDGLYRTIFGNLGFDIRFSLSEAIHHDDPPGPQKRERSCLIATRC
jgi:hypothetical protein